MESKFDLVNVFHGTASPRPLLTIPRKVLLAIYPAAESALCTHGSHTFFKFEEDCGDAWAIGLVLEVLESQEEGEHSEIPCGKSFREALKIWQAVVFFDVKDQADHVFCFLAHHVRKAGLSRADVDEFVARVKNEDPLTSYLVHGLAVSIFKAADEQARENIWAQLRPYSALHRDVRKAVFKHGLTRWQRDCNEGRRSKCVKIPHAGRCPGGPGKTKAKRNFLDVHGDYEFRKGGKAR